MRLSPARPSPTQRRTSPVTPAREEPDVGGNDDQEALAALDLFTQEQREQPGTERHTALTEALAMRTAAMDAEDRLAFITWREKYLARARGPRVAA